MQCVGIRLFLLADWVLSVDVHLYAKFCQNWSVHYGDIMIFRFF